MFKKMRGIKLPYEKQGLIYFTCRDYKNLSAYKRAQIESLCSKIGREDEDALFDFLTTNKSAVKVAAEHFIDESKLYRLRKRFYEEYARII